MLRLYYELGSGCTKSEIEDIPRLWCDEYYFLPVIEITIFFVMECVGP